MLLRRRDPRPGHIGAEGSVPRPPVRLETEQEPRRRAGAAGRAGGCMFTSLWPWTLAAPALRPRPLTSHRARVVLARRAGSQAVSRAQEERAAPGLRSVSLESINDEEEASVVTASTSHVAPSRARPAGGCAASTVPPRSALPPTPAEDADCGICLSKSCASCPATF